MKEAVPKFYQNGQLQGSKLDIGNAIEEAPSSLISVLKNWVIVWDIGYSLVSNMLGKISHEPFTFGVL